MGKMGKPIKITTLPVVYNLAILILFSTPVIAGEWEVKPSVTLVETYTDNLLLSNSSAEKDEFITEVNPGISITGKGGRTNVNVHYSMQNILYARESGRNKVNHLLLADGNAELVKEHFFIDGAASISQQLLSADAGLRTDNLNPGNRDDVYNLKLSPYYVHNFNGFVDSTVRYTYDGVRVDQGSSDSDGDRLDVNLSSGHKFSKLSWDIAYQDETVDRDTASDIEHETTLGSLRYLLGRGFSIVATAGNEQHDFNTNQTVVNGSYWSAGIGWRPGRKFSIDVQEGDNFKSASVSINPTERTSFQTTWSDREVGTNLGEVWSGNFSLRTKRSTWQASYLEDTTSFQQLSSLFTYHDPDTGVQILKPAEGQEVVLKRDGFPDSLPGEFTSDVGEFLGNFFEVSDNIFTRKRGQFSVKLQTAKSTFLISLYNEKRSFELSADDQVLNGGTFSWNWRFASRTSLILSALEQRLDFQDSTREDKLNTYEAKIKKVVNPKVDTSVSYRHATLDSTNAPSEYDENRLVLSLTMKF